MRSISPKVLVATVLLAWASTGAAQEDGAVPAVEPDAPPPVLLAPPAVTVSWAWIVPNPDGEGERLAPVSPADPRTPLERLGTVRFRYEGEVAADALQIQVPLPPDLDYVPESATGPGAEAAYLDELRAVRWILPGPLEPGTAGLVSFRARTRPLPGAEDAGENP